MRNVFTVFVDINEFIIINSMGHKCRKSQVDLIKCHHCNY